VRKEAVWVNIVAIIACRNEELYLANCLQHLLDNGISFAIIDNESTDGTAELLKCPKFRKGLVDYKSLPFNGVFELRAQLAAKEEMAERLRADWVIHHDADEVMHSYHHGETILDAVERLAATGANVINFDEFVFLPIDHVYKPGSGWQLMRHYYFFQPAPCRLMRAWNKYDGKCMVVRDGHRRAGEIIRVAGESLVLRHYIFRSQAHAYLKYTLRSFSGHETRNLGWHRNRIDQPIRSFAFPSAVSLERLADPRSCALSRSRPRTKHYWQWEACSTEHGHGTAVSLDVDPRLRRYGTA
jgi:glycosyltransferase involved in cell wall biosynthesis